MRRLMDPSLVIEEMLKSGKSLTAKVWDTEEFFVALSDEMRAGHRRFKLLCFWPRESEPPWELGLYDQKERERQLVLSFGQECYGMAEGLGYDAAALSHTEAPEAVFTWLRLSAKVQSLNFGEEPEISGKAVDL